MRQIKKVALTFLGLCSIFAGSAFADAQQYDIQYTNDTIPNNNFAISAAGSQTLYNYDGNFSHIIYSSTPTNVKPKETLYVSGQQQSTNSSYPSVYVQYTFVDKGTKETDPSDDVLLTGTTTSKEGDYTKSGAYNLSFYIGSQANTSGTTAYLRAWNYNNSNGSNSKNTVHIWGAVTK